MVKLYKRRPDGRLAYHEAWEHEGVVTEHWGIVGDHGETKKHKLKRDENAESAIERVLKPARRDGFEEIDLDDHSVLLVEYAVEGMGSSRDLDKRHALESRMNNLLGWTGLGHCDGGSIGSGTMEVCCYVVEFKIAKSVIERDLKGTRFIDYARVYQEDGDE